MTKIQKLKTIAFLAIFMLFFAIQTSAAEIRVDSKSQEIKTGEQFSASVFLNTEGESINAVEGKILFPADLLDLKEIRDGNSIINFWVEKPKVTGNQIIFSGIIPGGYQDAKSFLFSVIFQAKTIGNSAIEISDAQVLLNDGKGTLAKTAIFNFQFSISKEASNFEGQAPNPIEDIESPEDFKPEISQNIGMFDGQWFLVFATQDKGAGIDHYEILETGNKRQEARGWITAESPYVLKDQKLKSYIYVKAVDKAGNEKIETFLPKYPPRWYGQPLIWSIIILGIIIAYLIRFKIKNAKRKSAI